MTLDQVKAAKPTGDYDTQYGATTGFWTTDLFVEAVYKSLSEKKPMTGRSARILIALALAVPACVLAQGVPQGPGIGGPGGPPQPPKPAEQAAPVDFTGYWVSVVTEDWRWRMVTPIKATSPASR